MLDGGRLVAQALKQEGVEVVFTLSGGHIMPIYQGCLDEGIRIVDVRHEQAAAHAADGWARLTRGLGVALVTAGPGVTDAVTGIVNAQQADSPVLVIGGQAPSDQFEMGSLQEMDHVTLVSSVTKWARSVAHTRRIPEFVSIAARHALTGRKGPVFLEIPVDVLLGGVEESSLEARTQTRTAARIAPDPAYLDRACALIEKCERPVIMAGSGIWWDEAWSALAMLAARMDAPVYLNAMARGALPPGNPHLFNASRRKGLAEADVVLVAGAPLDFRLGYGQSFNPAAKIVQVDVEPREIGRNRDVDVGMIANLDLGLGALEARLPQGDHARWLRSLREREDRAAVEMNALMQSDITPIHPLRLIKEVRETLDDDTIFIGDGGNIVAQAGKAIQVARPGHWMDPGRFGCLGVGLPFALAAKLARPQARVLILHGDGAFGLNGFEFDTAVRFNLPMVSIIGNDAAWGQIRGPQMNFYGADRAVATALAYSRYDRLVEALGGHGEYVEEPGQLRGAIERAWASGKPACVNVRIDAEANAAVSANSMVI